MIKMAYFKVFLLICGVVAGVNGSEVDIDPQPLPSSSIPPQPTSTSKPTTSTTSSTTTTVTPSTSTITTPKSTTTIQPTPSPNTTTTSTTTKPTTPTPPVDPVVANWTVNFPNSTRNCIFMSVAAQFDLKEADSNKTLKINIPLEATTSGSCDSNNTESLIISWGQNNSLEFNFEKTSAGKFDLSNISSTLNISLETGYVVYNLVHRNTEFSTPVQNSYKCARKQTLILTEVNSNTTIGNLQLSHLQYQAFRNATEHKFDSAFDCEASVTPDVVPIVVGCVLAILVVAVLAAYLFGRRRCQARGYLSM